MAEVRFSSKAPRIRRERFLPAAMLALFLPVLFLIYLQYRSVGEEARVSRQAMEENLNLAIEEVNTGMHADARELARRLGQIPADLFLPGRRGPLLPLLRQARRAYPFADAVAAFGLDDSGRPVEIGADASDDDPVLGERLAKMARAWLGHAGSPIDSSLSPTITLQGKDARVILTVKKKDGKVIGLIASLDERRRMNAGYLKLLIARHVGVVAASRGAIMMEVRDDQGALVCATPGYAGQKPEATVTGAALEWFPPGWSVGAAFRDGPAAQMARRALRRQMTINLISAGILIAALILVILAVRRQISSLTSRTAFVANLSHEFKTPLSLIRLSADTIRLRHREDPKVAGECCDYISGETVRLAGIVDRILEFARGQRRAFPYKFEMVDVAAAVREAMQIQVPLIRRREANVTLDLAPDLPAVRADPHMLGHAICALLDNALKYCDAAPAITLAAHRKRGHVVIAVADRGSGIEPKYLHDIFDPFFRVPSELVHDVKGSGLGLALVRQVAEAHGGHVEVTSKPGQGSTFQIFLPAAKG